MGSIRTIKPDFFRSESIAKLPLDARLTFIGMWTDADSCGRGVANARVLKGALWPLDDKITVDDVERCLKQLDRTSHIKLYEVDGKRYYQVSSWGEHQAPSYRRGESKYPAPPDEPVEPQQAKVNKEPRSTVGGKQKGTTAPSDFTVTPSLKEWATKDGHDQVVDLEAETQNFLDYHVAKGSTFVDWNRAWQKWIRTAVGFKNQRGSSRTSTTSRTATSQDLAARGAGRMSPEEAMVGMGKVVKLPGE